MTAPLLVYGAALRLAAAGRSPSMVVLDGAGWPLTKFDVSRWTGDLLPGDGALLAQCAGPTLDVGCGPGRLTAALHDRGIEAMGIDVSPEAVRQTRRRGAPATRADIYRVVPGERSWRTVLLADGNIGIGGDPARLLRRCAQLIDGAGSVVVEVDAPGEASWRGEVVLCDGVRRSVPFPWASVPADRLGAIAARCGLDVCLEWTAVDRWFTRLRRSA